MCPTPVTLPGSLLEESWAAVSIIQQNLWSYMLVPPPSRSALRAGEVLGLPEVFQDEEPAHWPKAAGTPPPVQEPGGLQGGGECTVVMEPFYPLNYSYSSLWPPPPPSAAPDGRGRRQEEVSLIFSWRGREASATSFQLYLKAHTALKILRLCSPRRTKRTKRTRPEDGGSSPGQEEGVGSRREKGKREQMKPRPRVGVGGQREDVMPQQIQRLQSCRPLVWARVDFTWFLICAFHFSASINRQSFNLCTWLLITFTKSKEKKCIPCISLLVCPVLNSSGP